jgi:hypothetical protein
MSHNLDEIIEQLCGDHPSGLNLDSIDSQLPKLAARFH